MHKQFTKFSSAFTIVELLVVIVVIGILATIIFISYTGIASQATTASLKSDLDNAKKQLKLYQVENSGYPANQTLLTNCPASGTNACFKPSPGNTIASYIVNNSATPQTFVLTLQNGSIIYEITDDSVPYSVTPQPLTAIGAITGTVEVGQTLTAGTLTPSGATATYQWQSSTSSNGTYTNISGAANSTYTLVSGDTNKYIKVVATGTVRYTGTATSTATIVVTNPWITIGTQTWATTNLDVGTRIDDSIFQTNNAILEKYCYNNNEANCTIYGGLYKWDEMMQYVATEGAQGICPTGSHIPSDNDWKILEIYLGMTQAQADATGYRGTDQGTKLKSGGSSGLNLLLSGQLYSEEGPDYYFGYLGTLGTYWSSTQFSLDTSYAFFRRVLSDFTTVVRVSNYKTDRFSVRCLKN